MNKCFERSPDGCGPPQLPGSPGINSPPAGAPNNAAPGPRSVCLVDMGRHHGRDVFVSPERFANGRSMLVVTFLPGQKWRTEGFFSAAFCLIHAKNQLTARRPTLNSTSGPPSCPLPSPRRACSAACRRCRRDRAAARQATGLPSRAIPPYPMAPAALHPGCSCMTSPTSWTMPLIAGQLAALMRYPEHLLEDRHPDSSGRLKKPCLGCFSVTFPAISRSAFTSCVVA